MRATTEVLLGDMELATLFLLEGRRIGQDGQVLLISEEFYKFIGYIDGIIREAQSQGHFPAVHPEALRSALFGAAEGLLRDRLLSVRSGFPAGYSIQEAEHTFMVLLSTIANIDCGTSTKHSAKAG